MADVTFEIRKSVAILSDRGKGWRKELNVVCWNDSAPKVDIREWNSDHTSMKKGITLSKQEFKVLLDAASNIDIESLADYAPEANANIKHSFEVIGSDRAVKAASGE